MYPRLRHWLEEESCGKDDGLTQRDIVVWVHGHILSYLDLVDGFQDCQAVAYTADAQLLQLGMLQRC